VKAVWDEKVKPRGKGEVGFVKQAGCKPGVKEERESYE